MVYYLSGLTCTDENFVQKARPNPQQASSFLLSHQHTDLPKLLNKRFLA